MALEESVETARLHLDQQVQAELQEAPIALSVEAKWFVGLANREVFMDVVDTHIARVRGNA